MRSLSKIVRRIASVFLAIIMIVGLWPNISFANINESVKKPPKIKERIEVFSKSGKIKPLEVDSSIFSKYSQKSKNNKSKESLNTETYNFDTVDILNNGSDSQNYCLLFAGDGYTASEQGKFLSKVREVKEYFMSQPPFNESDIKNKINMRAVCVTSNESGVSLDPNNPYDTFFKSTFNNYGIERLICVHDEDRVWNVVDQYMPECVCPVIICNSEKYGGSGGSICCLSANSDVADGVVHEFGHTAANLADEYWEETTDSTNRIEAPNRTGESNPNKCKWADLIGTNGVGLYSFSEAGVYDWYRPHQSCEMKESHGGFCEVCKREIRKVIKERATGFIDDNTHISDASELKSFLRKVANGASTIDKTATLTDDIYIDETISNIGSFNGTLNGNGHKISGLRINVEGGNVGLFSELGTRGCIKNIQFENCTITGSGFNAGIVGICRGIIEQCSFSGSITTNNVASGIAGNLNGGIIQDCYNLGTIYARNQVAGGIVGWMTSGTIKNCYGMGQISSGDSEWDGGVIAYKEDGTINNCYYLCGTGSMAYESNELDESQFRDGTLTGYLNNVNNVWRQGDEYPLLKIFSPEEETTTEQTTETPTQAPAPSGFSAKIVEEKIIIEFQGERLAKLYVDGVFTKRYISSGIFFLKSEFPVGIHSFQVSLVTDDLYHESLKTEPIYLNIEEETTANPTTTVVPTTTAKLTTTVAPTTNIPTTRPETTTEVPTTTVIKTTEELPTQLQQLQWSGLYDFLYGTSTMINTSTNNSYGAVIKNFQTDDSWDSNSKWQGQARIDDFNTKPGTSYKLSLDLAATPVKNIEVGVNMGDDSIEKTFVVGEKTKHVDIYFVAQNTLSRVYVEFGSINDPGVYDIEISNLTFTEGEEPTTKTTTQVTTTKKETTVAPTTMKQTTVARTTTYKSMITTAPIIIVPTNEKTTNDLQKITSQYDLTTKAVEVNSTVNNDSGIENEKNTKQSVVIKKIKKKKLSAKRIRVTVRKVARAKWYKVRVFKNKKNAKKNKKFILERKVRKNKFSIKSKKLVNKKKLFVRVRAYYYKYVGDSKKYVLSDWSKYKRVKIKK